MPDFEVLIWIAFIAIFVIGRILKAVFSDEDEKKRQGARRAGGAAARRAGGEHGRQKGKGGLRDFLRQLEEEVKGTSARRDRVRSTDSHRQAEGGRAMGAASRPSSFQKARKRTQHSSSGHSQQRKYAYTAAEAEAMKQQRMQEELARRRAAEEKRQRAFVGATSGRKSGNRDHTTYGDSVASSGPRKRGRKGARIPAFTFAPNVQTLRAAVVWAEILGKPRSLRPWAPQK